MTRSPSALPDDGENQLVLLLGRQAADGALADLLLTVEVEPTRPGDRGGSLPPAGPGATTPGRAWSRTAATGTSHWLTEPWLVTQADLADVERVGRQRNPH
jgi:hypothetical protein